MVTQVENRWRCDVCGYTYETREWVEKCEAWCTENKSCNLEIIAHGEAPQSNEGG